MTEMTSSAAEQAASTPTADGETSVAGSELTATAADAPASDGPTSIAPADTSPTTEPGVEAVPVLPVAAAVIDGEPPARPRHRRSLVFRFGVSFVLGLLLTAGVGAGVLYAWDLQYDGRILPGVRIGATELGGLTR